MFWKVAYLGCEKNHLSVESTAVWRKKYHFAQCILTPPARFSRIMSGLQHVPKTLICPEVWQTCQELKIRKKTKRRGVGHVIWSRPKSSSMMRWWSREYGFVVLCWCMGWRGGGCCMILLDIITITSSSWALFLSSWVCASCEFEHALYRHYHRHYYQHCVKLNMTMNMNINISIIRSWTSTASSVEH